MGKRDDAIRKALTLFQGSMRQLAIEAGVDPKLLAMIRDGERTATPRTIELVAAALERLSESNAKAARILRKSL